MSNSNGGFKPEAGLLRALREQEEEFQQRQKEIGSQQEDMSRPGGDTKLDTINRNVEAKKNAHFSDKIYLFPEEFNALRRELEENWQTFFHSINPEMKVSPAWAMVFDAPKFVGMCNGALQMDVQFDSDNVAQICKRFLNGFRVLRGLKPLE